MPSSSVNYLTRHLKSILRLMFTVVKSKLIFCSVTLHKKTLTLENDYAFESQKLRQALVHICIGRQLSAPHPPLAFTFAPLADGSRLRNNALSNPKAYFFVLSFFGNEFPLFLNLFSSSLRFKIYLIDESLFITFLPTDDNQK